MCLTLLIASSYNIQMFPINCIQHLCSLMNEILLFIPRIISTYFINQHIYMYIYKHFMILYIYIIIFISLWECNDLILMKLKSTSFHTFMSLSIFPN